MTVTDYVVFKNLSELTKPIIFNRAQNIEIRIFRSNDWLNIGHKILFSFGWIELEFFMERDKSTVRIRVRKGWTDITLDIIEG